MARSQPEHGTQSSTGPQSPLSFEVISEDAKDRRKSWIQEIRAISSGDFDTAFSVLAEKLQGEIDEIGTPALLHHLRLCSAIPESYGHDSTEEKLYSKYTDALIAAAYTHMGLASTVLSDRADAGDVEAVSEDYSFVADAKAFRLSRTAKNQKDFKVQAMDRWKYGKPFAMVVCPIYQLPSRTSQIYQQAASRNVCVFSYSHLAVLVSLVDLLGTRAVSKLLHDIFRTVESMNPSKDAWSYWQAVNQCMLQHGGPSSDAWRTEKIATTEAISVLKELALDHYASEREKIMRLSRKQAIEQLIYVHKIDSRISKVRSMSNNSLMEVN